MRAINIIMAPPGGTDINPGSCGATNPSICVGPVLYGRPHHGTVCKPSTGRRCSSEHRISWTCIPTHASRSPFPMTLQSCPRNGPGLTVSVSELVTNPGRSWKCAVMTIRSWPCPAEAVLGNWDFGGSSCSVPYLPETRGHLFTIPHLVEKHECPLCALWLSIWKEKQG